MRPLPPPSPADRLLGALAFALWRMLGALVLPVALLHPRLRRHTWGLPVPEPGWTWIHGDSAGEHRAVRALAPLLVPGAWPTRASLRTPVPGALPAPLDLPFVVGRWLDRARPGRLVLVEGGLWPGWIAACRARGIPVVLVNARPSRGLQRWRRAGPLGRWLLAGVRVVSQDAVGDLKLAAPPPRLQGPPLPPGAVVGCSTRAGDEAALLAAWHRLPAPRPPLALAPRRLSRVPALIDELSAAGVRVRRRSAGGDAPASGDDIVIIDTFGELGALLDGAGAAFIGGTFSPALGGHSPAEAVRAGVPVVHGPHTQANPAAFAAAPTHPAATPAALAPALAAALAAPRGRPLPGPDSARHTLLRLPPPAVVPARAPRPWLRPLVPLVRAVAARGRGWSGRPVAVGVPVISVGGLTAGGSGKTPVAAWLAAHLPGAWVVGRGHRRPAAGPELRLGWPGRPPVHGLGDELEMIRRRGIPVVSGPDRVAAAEAAVAAGAQVIVLDDGFQHRRLARSLDICCLDGRWPGGGGPLPVGTRREPWSGLGRADVLWIHNRVADPAALARRLPDRLRVHSRPRPDHWRVGGAVVPLGARPPAPVTVAAGLARPEGLLCALLGLGILIDDTVLVGDHRPLQGLRPGWVLSEKDAARLPPGAPQWALCMALELDEGPVPPALARLVQARTGLRLQGAP